MSRVLVDANVLLDLLTDDPQWYAWSAAQLDACAARAELCINPIIYAEMSVGFNRIEALDDALSDDPFSRVDLPWEAGFLAGKAYLNFRRANGSRTLPLPDFYIGAHHVTSLAEREQLIAKFNQHLSHLRRAQFAARTKRMNPDQRDLFDETMAADIAALEAHLETLQSPSTPAKSPRRTPIRRPSPTHLRRDVVVHEPASGACNACRTDLVKIGEHHSENEPGPNLAHTCAAPSMPSTSG